MTHRSLTADQFVARKIGQKDYLTLNLPGKVIVLFKSSTCHVCIKVSPLFSDASRQFSSINGEQIVFGSIDVAGGMNRALISVAKQTTTPIQSVPTLMFFSDSIPIAKLQLDGITNLATIRGFLGRSCEDAALRERQTHQQVPFRQPYQQPQLPPQQYHNPQSHHQNPPPPKSFEVEPDNANRLLIPHQLIPHNNPWEGAMSTKRYDGLD